MNTITNSSLTNVLNNGYSSLLGSYGASANFGSIFSQALTAAKTPAQKAEVAFAQVQYSDLNVLASMDSGSSDSSNLSSLAGLASLLGGNDPFAAPPAWETQLASLLGPNSTAAQALNLDQQAALASQSLMNGNLSSLGSGSSVNSLI